MEKPKAPQGWVVEEWDYRGESPKSYKVGDDHTVFSLKRLEDDSHVWMSVRTGFGGAKANDFNVYRAGNYEVPHLDPNIPTAKKGIEFALMVAEKYMDTPTEEIPGAREGLYKSKRKLFRLLAKKNIPTKIICPDGVYELKPKKKKK